MSRKSATYLAQKCGNVALFGGVIRLALPDHVADRIGAGFAAGEGKRGGGVPVGRLRPRRGVGTDRGLRIGGELTALRTAALLVEGVAAGLQHVMHVLVGEFQAGLMEEFRLAHARM